MCVCVHHLVLSLSRVNTIVTMFSQRTNKMFKSALAIKTDSSDSSESDFDSDDSIFDKNYIPSEDFSSVSSDNEEIYSEIENKNPTVNEQQNQTKDTLAKDLWKPITLINNLYPYIGPMESCHIPESTKTPIDFFQLFLTDEIINIIVVQTNEYASQIINKGISKNARMNLWKPTTLPEMKEFFSVILAMGLVHVPDIVQYWSKDTLYKNTFISKIMSRDRFLILLKCLHFSNNLEDQKIDKLYKIKPILKPILENFEKYLTPGESMIIDESMVPWRGRLNFRQYIKNKRHPYGIKLYKLCNPEGYTFNVKVYTGKGTDITPGRSHADAVVNTLMTKYFNCGRTLFCDNFYTSIELAENLLHKHTKICGTLRSNRKGVPKSVVTKKLKKGEIYGAQKENIKVIKWVDKRPVLILTTIGEHTATLVESKKIINNQTVMKPKCVLDYNEAKKGVDYR